MNKNKIKKDNLETSLQMLYKRKLSYFQKKWNRSLPFSEMIVDRWEKAKRLGFGKNVSIYDNSIVFGKVTVGADTWIGPFTILDGSGGGLTIGKNCSISSGVHIYTHDSVEWALSGGKAKYKKTSVSIGDNCYIGPNAIISRGVTIGNRCVIGACSFVNTSIPDNSMVIGIPGKIVGKIIVDKKGMVSYKYKKSRSGIKPK